MKGSSPGPLSQEYLQLITQHQGLIYSHIRKMVGDPIFAQDALQETNIVLWKKADTFEMGTNFGAFACRVGYLKTLELLREKGRKTSFLTFDSDIVEAIGSVAPEKEVFPQERALAECMAKLDERDRQLLTLRYEECQTVREIAKIKGKSEGSFQQVFFKLRNILKICIEGKVSEV